MDDILLILLSEFFIVVSWVRLILPAFKNSSTSLDAIVVTIYLLIPIGIGIYGIATYVRDYLFEKRNKNNKK